MPVYQYKGLRSDGQGTAGVIDAESLKAHDISCDKGECIPPMSVSSDSPMELGAARSCSSGVGGAVLTAQERAILTRQLATLLTAGLPLIDALAVLIEQTEKKSIQSLLAEVREQIRGGKALSRALEAFPQDFTTVYLHMVRAGEASGALEGILVRLAEFLDGQLKLKHKVTNATMYPVLMLVVAVAILGFLMVFVVPKITGVFADLHQVLPWPTRFLIAVSDFLTHYWPVLLGGTVCCSWGWRGVRSPHPSVACAQTVFCSRCRFLGR